VAKKLTDILFERKNGRRELQRARLVNDVLDRIVAIMKQNNVSRSDLASKLSVTKGRVTRMLCGDSNMTLKTLADVFYALDRSVTINDVPLTMNQVKCHRASVPTTAISITQGRGRYRQAEVKYGGEVAKTGKVA
jgi:transcriptional regulator with XRE-family HTH domain